MFISSSMQSWKNKSDIGTGTIMTLSIYTKITFSTMRIIGALLDAGLIVEFIGSLGYLGPRHPDKAPTSDYIQRLNYLYQVNTLSQDIGNAFYKSSNVTDRYKNIFAVVNEWKLGSNFVFKNKNDTNPILPPKWLELSRSIDDMSQYKRIGWGGVYITHRLFESDIFDGAARNIWTLPGMTLESQVFWNVDPYYSLGIMNHEAMHGRFWGWTHSTLMGFMKLILYRRPQHGAILPLF
jgi:hypothetical protein